ncbi:MAG: squalene synthase HpnC [Ignavibacteria bacterium]
MQNNLQENIKIHPFVLQTLDINAAYVKALNLAGSHYENFPVISKFLPPHLRKHVAIIYQFARQADDLADEGNENKELRLSNLEKYEAMFNDCLNEKFSSNFWAAVHNSINEMKLSPGNLYNLLKAFKQDVVKSRFNNFEEILYYCSNSANPIGRLLLELFDTREKLAFEYSDKVCTALQLANFYQDISVDIKKNRIYIPLDEMKEFNVSEKDILSEKINDNYKRLIEYQVNRTRELFDVGKKIIKFLPVRLRYQIKWTILGGEEILSKIKSNNYDVSLRPTINKSDILKLIVKAIIK